MGISACHQNSQRKSSHFICFTLFPDSHLEERTLLLAGRMARKSTSKRDISSLNFQATLEILWTILCAVQALKSVCLENAINVPTGLIP